MGGRGGDANNFKAKKIQKSKAIRNQGKRQLEGLEIIASEEAAKSFQDTCVNL